LAGASIRGTASGKIARYIRSGGAKGGRLESTLPRPCHRIPLSRKPGDDSAEGLDSHSTMRSGGTTRKEEDPRARCKRGIISRRVSNLIADAVRRPEGGKREGGGGEASELRRSPGCGRGWVVLLRYWPGSGG